MPSLIKPQHNEFSSINLYQNSHNDSNKTDIMKSKISSPKAENRQPLPKEFTTLIYKKAIKSLNAKHREILAKENNCLTNKQITNNSNLSSISRSILIETPTTTNNLNSYNKSLDCFENKTRKNTQLKKIDHLEKLEINHTEYNRFLSRENSVIIDLNNLKPIFSKSLANKIAKAKILNERIKTANSNCTIATNNTSDSKIQTNNSIDDQIDILNKAASQSKNNILKSIETSLRTREKFNETNKTVKAAIKKESNKTKQRHKSIQTNPIMNSHLIMNENNLKLSNENTNKSNKIFA
jgi:hypothetical protein